MELLIEDCGDILLLKLSLLTLTKTPTLWLIKWVMAGLKLSEVSCDNKAGGNSI